MANEVATTLLRDPDPAVRRAAIEELRQEAQLVGRCEPIIEALGFALSDPHVAVQDAAARWLMECNPEMFAVHVLPLLHGAVQPRSMAMEVLQQLGSQAVDPILGAATQSDPPIRQSVLQALGQYPGMVSVSIWRKAAMEDPDVWVRSRAVEQLAVYNDEAVVTFLIALLERVPALLQLAVARALGSLDASEALEPFQRLQAVTEPEVPQEVRDALVQLQISSHREGEAG